MTIDRTTVPSPPLVCELVLGDLLETHVEAFRGWVSLLWDLTIEALVNSGTVESPDEVFDKDLWEGTIATGMLPKTKMRTRRLSARGWSDMLGADDLRGFGVSARPLPHVAEPIGSDSGFDIGSSWHPDIPNSVSWKLPARYVLSRDRTWVSRLTEGFIAFGTSVRAQAGCMGWMRQMTFTTHPGWREGFSGRLWLPGWAMLLGDEHLAALGGVSSLEESGVFTRLEQVDDGLYYLESRTHLFDFQPAQLARLEEVLRPILLPPPFDPARALEQSL